MADSMATIGEIPFGLAQLQDYQELTEVQKKNFLARLNYCVEVADSIKAWLNKSGDWEGREDFLDDIELDIASAQSPPTGCPDIFVSSWLIHSSWTFALEKEALWNALARPIIIGMDQALPPFGTAPELIDCWLGDQANIIHSIIVQFCSSSSPTDAIAHLIALDVVMANLLTGLYKLRLGGRRTSCG